MIKKSAFTLIEVLIALAISSFIMVAMFRIYLNSVEYVNTSSEQMLFNRKIYLLFDQIEKDLSAAFIPTLYEEEKVKEPAKDGEKKDDKKEEKKTVEEPKKQKKLLNFFKATIYEDQAEKIKDKKWELFKSVNFITTNPLQVYGQRKIRLVRVMYELVKDKEKSTREKMSYLLYRKESEDLENETLKESEEFSKKETKNLIRKQLVVDNVKGFYVDYMNIKTLNEKEKLQQTQERELAHSFVWDLKGEGKKDQSGKEKEKKLPTFILLKIVLWNDDLSKQQSFDDMIPIFAYFPEEKKEEKKDEKTNEKKDDGKAAPTKLTMRQVLGQPQNLVAQADQSKVVEKIEEKKGEKVEDKKESPDDESGFAFEAGDQQIMITPEMMQSIRNRLLTALQDIGKD